MVARVVVVGNEKGGAGKTTVSVNLAAMAAQARRRVVLIDADQGQRSAGRWAVRRRDANPGLPPVLCMSVGGPKCHIEVRSIADSYDVVVVDTGAQDSAELRAVAAVAQVLVVPVQPDALDLWTLPTMAAIYRRSLPFNAALRVVLAVNRVPHQAGGQAAIDVKQWISDDVPDLAGAPIVSLVDRSFYGRATAEGLGVAELSRRDFKAAREMAALYHEVMR